MNRAHTRRQIDVNKSLVKVLSAEEFFAKDNEEGVDIMNHERTPSNSELKKKTTITEAPPDNNANIPVPAIKKQEIIIPITKQMDNPLRAMLPDYEEICAKKRRLQTHYVRISYIDPLPNPDTYEPTDKDLQFLKEINEKITKTVKGNNEISAELFVKLIETWENVTDKNDVILMARALSSAESLYPAAIKDHVGKIYEVKNLLLKCINRLNKYWKVQRDSLQRPLLRKFLKVVNKDDNNPNAAFRTRKNPKMTTRRTQKANETENIEKLRAIRQDLDIVFTLLGNIRYREILKLELTDLSIMKFESSLKEKPDHALNNKLVEKYKENYENQKYLQIREKMKGYNATASEMIKARAPVSEPESTPPIIKAPIKLPTFITNPIATSSEELNFDLGSFIATIIDESLSKDITPLKIQKLDQPTSFEDAKTNGVEPIFEKMPELEKLPSYKRLASTHEPIIPTQPSPSESLQIQGTNSIRVAAQAQKQPQKQLYQQQPLPQQQQSLQADEKSIVRYIIRRRIGRQKRILLDRILEDDENSLPLHHKDYYKLSTPPENLLIAPEVAQKIPNNNLRQLYLARFARFKEICPFNDSDDENDPESTKMMKNLANNFKAFIKQKRPVNPVI